MTRGAKAHPPTLPPPVGRRRRHHRHLLSYQLQCHHSVHLAASPPPMAPVSAGRSSVSPDNLAQLAKIPVGFTRVIASSASSTITTPPGASVVPSPSLTATPSFYTAPISSTAVSLNSSLKPTPIASEAAAPIPLTHSVPGWQSALQAITHNIPLFLRTTAEAIIGKVRNTRLFHFLSLSFLALLKLKRIFRLARNATQHSSMTQT